MVFVAAPGLFLLGWAFLGHFVTLDEDMPGEWSNPQDSKKVWYSSVVELLLKLLAFATLLLIVLL